MSAFIHQLLTLMPSPGGNAPTAVCGLCVGLLSDPPREVSPVTRPPFSQNNVHVWIRPTSLLPHFKRHFISYLFTALSGDLKLEIACIFNSKLSQRRRRGRRRRRRGNIPCSLGHILTNMTSPRQGGGIIRNKSWPTRHTTA